MDKLRITTILFILTLMLGLQLRAEPALAKKQDNPNKPEKEFKHIASLSLSSNLKSFTWAGPPALSHYTVDFCDGETTGKIDINPQGEITTISYDTKISTVYGKGGQQYEQIDGSCEEQEEQKDEPKDEPGNDQPSDNGGDSDEQGADDSKQPTESPEEVLGAETLAYTGSSGWKYLITAGVLAALLAAVYLKSKRNIFTATVYHEEV